MIKRTWQHRHLVVALTHRQYQLRYRQSAVGVAWAFVTPLATLGVATLLFHKVVGVNTGRTPYAIFALAALVPWNFFASSLTFGVQSVSQSQALISRLPFPRAALPLSTIGASFIDLGVAVVLFVGFSYAMGLGLPITALWFPILIVVEGMLISGLVLLTSALNVFARDFKLAIPIGVQLWLLMTPVMYPLKAVPPDLRVWYMLNPMTGLVETSRQLLVLGAIPSLELVASTLAGAALFLAVGLWYFGAVEMRFADVV